MPIKLDIWLKVKMDGAKSFKGHQEIALSKTFVVLEVFINHMLSSCFLCGINLTFEV